MKTLDMLKIDVINYYEKNGLTAKDSIGEFIAVNQMKKKILKERHDTYLGIEWNEAIEIIILQGFNVIHEEKFLYDNKEESLLIFWDGASLIKLTSFNKNVNNLELFYNWYCSEINRFEVTGTGCYLKEGVWDKIKNEVIKIPLNVQEVWFRDEAEQWLKKGNYGLIWSGYKDVREGFVAILTRMKELGTFVVPWLSLELLYLTHYGEKFDSSNGFEKYEEYRLSRLAKLPVEIRKALGRE